MKKLIAMLIPGLMLFAGASAKGDSGVPPESNPETSIEVGTDVSTIQSQDISIDAGDASSASYSGASITTTSISNYRARTQPIATYPPYLPYWTHGGWGTIKAYFPNGPNSDDQVYERVFNPGNPDDMRGLRGVLESLPYESPLGVFGGILNGVWAVFGGPDNYHHGRGFEIANSLVRTRRPRRKPLLVFIDSNVDTNLLRKAGYAYVGKVSLEGAVNRNWDQVYDAAVAEALPWDVDILLVSGGMKGVTVGSNLSFPGAGGAYSQANYSISMFGAVSSGITEGKGKALVSAAGYRYCPRIVNRRRIPKAFYEKFHAKLTTRPGPQTGEPIPAQTVVPQTTLPQIDLAQIPASQKTPPQKASTVSPKARKRNIPGIDVSRQLYDMAGFGEHQRVHNATIN